VTHLRGLEARAPGEPLGERAPAHVRHHDVEQRRRAAAARPRAPGPRRRAPPRRARAPARSPGG
jgi:hypothetical protein